MTTSATDDEQPRFFFFRKPRAWNLSITCRKACAAADRPQACFTTSQGWQTDKRLQTVRYRQWGQLRAGARSKEGSKTCQIETFEGGTDQADLPDQEVRFGILSLLRKWIDLTGYRKDDYAFFLTPVNVSSVTGYSDVVKRPMDFGTMTTKVNKGKYRSLEEFAVSLACPSPSCSSMLQTNRRLLSRISVS